MGSFNVACSVSRITICGGMPVAYLPLTPNKYRYEIEAANNALIYPWCYYNPLTLPIFGEYFDYGFISQIERNENVRTIEKHLNRSIDNIVGAEGDSPFPGMFIHRDIYQCMIDNQVDEMGRDTTKGNHFGSMSRNFLNNKYKEYRKKLVNIEEAKKSGDKFKIAMAGLEDLEPNYIMNREFKKFIELYRPAIMKGRLRKALVDFTFFTHSLFYANIHYFPAMNGCQFGSHYGNRIVHQKTIEILNEVIKKEESWK